MTMQRGNLGSVQSVPTTASAVVTNASGKRTYVRGFVVFNGNTATETLGLHVVDNVSGSLGSATAGNKILEMQLAAKETVTLALPYPITMTGTNDAVFASASTASKINLVALGDTDA